MKKYLLTVVFALVIGFFLGNFLLKQYNDYKSIMVSKQGRDVMFVQYGVYSSAESMYENTINLENYIYKIEDSKYYVYVGITMDNNNVARMQSHFKELGYDTIVKSYFIKNEEFISLLSNFDTVLSSTNDKTAVASIICQTLQKYEEVVNGGKN